ncbi:tobamovirus multiplication protein 2A-like isoform X2 [Actinidia eriantha]|uniref:tobamovirus multiplication protein 2A-like isoform X2 n=1 Tax=Actinidia eriantha TaxID=165200 RepID=UPI00258DE827|nr:tobamovirus multiplication protein 2A-like isoform X2 [Actinidia eriantha]
MACRGCWECLLKLLNFLLTLSGLAIVGYGIYLFVEYEKSSSSNLTAAPADDAMIQLGRPMLVAVSLSSSFLDNLPKACSNTKWMLPDLLLVILLILVELACAAFIFFDKSWQDDIPTDKTGDFDMIYDFLEENWEIVKWVALGVIILEALLFLLAVIVRAANRPVECDSDDEYIGGPRQQARQPLINRPPVPAMGVPVTLDQRPSRNDAWSTRMREKYGLDTTEFTYNPSESNRYQQAPAQPPEERSRCTVM